MRSKSLWIAALALAMMGAQSGLAALITERPLPIANLNDAAGANRSNLAINFGDGAATGDTFGIAAGNWIINSLTVWSVPTYDQALGWEFSSVSLYMGKNGGALSLTSSGNIAHDASNTNSNPNITHQKVYYPLITSYEGSSGVYRPVYQTTFGGLNFAAGAGDTVAFSVYGTGGYADNNSFTPDPFWGVWFNHGSNAALSGNAQPDADGFVQVYDTSNFSTVAYNWATGSAINFGGSQYPAIWDKDIDLNFSASGLSTSEIPEPGTVAMIGAGLLALAGLRLRRRA
jgi:hypothetical protein